MSRPWSLLAALVLAACGPVDLVVASVPDAGLTDGGPPAPCVDDAECGVGSFCEKASCGDALGRCHRRAAVCEERAEPVCGCDGVTYWNECERRHAGVSLAARGECPAGRPCDATTPCPGESRCALLVRREECPAAPSGTCWLVPPACPSERRWSACGQPGSCIDLCTAIHAGTPAFRLPGPCP